jgi:hypothetical protein
MAERRIIEKELEVLRNEQNVLSLIGDYIVDKVKLRVDDTIGPKFALTFEKPDGYVKDFVEDFVILRVRVMDGTLSNVHATIYSRSLREYNILTIPLFKRYRTPFRDYEIKIGSVGYAPPTPQEKDIIRRDGRLWVKPEPYRGNPQFDITIGDRVAVDILTPYQLIPEKSKVMLQFIELLGHIGPEEILIE